MFAVNLETNVMLIGWESGKPVLAVWDDEVGKFVTKNSNYEEFLYNQTDPVLSYASTVVVPTSLINCDN